MMKDWPSGSYLVAECEEIGMFIVGYKYSYKKKGTFLGKSSYLLNTSLTIASTMEIDGRPPPSPAASGSRRRGLRKTRWCGSGRRTAPRGAQCGAS